MPYDQGPLLLGVAWSFTVAASVMVAARYYCRIAFLSNIWWDDFWMAASLFFGWAMTITWTVYTGLKGTGYNPLTPSQMSQINEMNWISQVWCITALVTGKIAIAALIKRLQAPCRWRTIVLWIAPSIIALWCSGQIIMIFVQCRPVGKLYNPELPGTCWDPKIVVINAQSIAAYLSFLDLLLAALPVQMIWKLQMPLRRKLSICALLSTGIVAFAVSIVKINMLPADLQRDTDFTRLSVLLFVWNSIEVNVVIIAGCLPTIMPILERLKGKKSDNFRSKVNGSGKHLMFERRATGSGMWVSIRQRLFNSPSRTDNYSNFSNNNNQRGINEPSESLSVHLVGTDNSDVEMDNGIRVTKDLDVTTSHNRTG